jgi:soluble lytic murein transglycosylase-like protein
MECRIYVLILLSQAFVPCLVFGSQFSQGESMFVPHEMKDKFTLTRSCLTQNLLVKIPHESMHLRLFDQAQNIKITNYKKNQEEALYKNSLEQAFEEEMMYFRLQNAVSSQEYIEDIFIVSREFNIDPLLLHAIAEIESSYNPTAISPAGAKGLMQVMPATARRFGMNNPETELLVPMHNLRISSNYLRSLHGLFGNNLPLILAAYNAGENAVIKYGYSIPPYRETENYVSKVMNRYRELKYKTMNF